MKQRIVVIAILAVFVLACAVLAQDAGTRPRLSGQNNLMRPIAKRLCLTKDQVKSIAGIVKQFRADAKKILQSNAGKDEKKCNIQSLKQTAGQSILDTLNADQRAEAEKMNLVDKLLSPRPRMMFLCMLARLNLSDQQKATVKSIMKASGKEIKAVRRDTSLTLDVKKAKCKEIREDTINQIKAQLNPDQLKKFEELLQKQPKTCTGTICGVGGQK